MPSRRNSIELSADEVRVYIDSRKTLIIVSNGKDGYPHTMPMWFVLGDDGTIDCTTFAKSQKVLNYQRDPKATLLVESGTEYAQLKGVMIYAHTDIIADVAQVTETLVKINSRGRTLSQEAAQQLRGAVSKTASKRVVVRFVPLRYVSWDHAKLGGRY